MIVRKCDIIHVDFILSLYCLYTLYSNMCIIIIMYNVWYNYAQCVTLYTLTLYRNTVIKNPDSQSFQDPPFKSLLLCKC